MNKMFCFLEETKAKISKTSIWLFILSIAGIFYRSYPHLYLIPRWIIEEEGYVYTILDLIKTGTTFRLGYQPVLEQYLVYFIYLITHIDPTILCQYVNPIIGGLTIIPIYYILRKISTQKVALVATTLWTFSENMIYRSSIFNSTESLGFFFAMLALYMYLNTKDKEQRNSKIKFFCGFLVFIVISMYTHILPAVFIIGLVLLDIFLNGNYRHKVYVAVVLCLVVLFLISSLNPHQVMTYFILPSSMSSQFKLSNIFLYSISDLLLGVSIFFGSVVMVILSLISILLYKPKINIMFEYLFGCILLFVVSWLFYSPYLIAPTRVIFYFILPLSFFTSLLISKFKTILSIIFILIIITTMILTSINGANTMLYINNAMTSDEYEFLGHSSIIHNTYNFTEWWTDVPMKNSLIFYSSDLRLPLLQDSFYTIENQRIEVNLNLTVSTTKTTINANETTTVEIIPPFFKYIILSPRMEKSAFFFFKTKYRTVQINQPIPDIWKDLPDWKLVEEYKNIKIYKWIGTSIDG